MNPITGALLPKSPVPRGLSNLPVDLAERGLTGRLILSYRHEVREVADFIAFHDGAASFPWKVLPR